MYKKIALWSGLLLLFAIVALSINVLAGIIVSGVVYELCFGKVAKERRDLRDCERRIRKL